MSERGNRSTSGGDPGPGGDSGPMQESRLTPEQISQLEEAEEWEDLMEEPTEGSLSIISVQDVPGAPG